MTTLGDTPATAAVAPLATGRFADPAAPPGRNPARTRRAGQLRSHLQACVIGDQSATAGRRSRPDRGLR